jgi:hypothetical protein
MKGKLNKVANGYVLLVDNIMYATDNDKLHKQNCDEIFGIYSPSDLSKVLVEGERGAFEFGYCLAREHNKDKVFTLDDIRNAMDWIMTQYFEFHEQPTTGRREQYLESIQQPTEIEVTFNPEEKDSDGCLILSKL